MKYLLCIIVSIFLLSFIVLEFNKSNEYASKLDAYITSYPQEKIYVHTDKPYYALGDDIWFKVYLLDSRTHQRVTPSSLVYVELINPDDEVIVRRNIKMDLDSDHGDFRINGDWTPGTYAIRAYTAYMCNYDDDFLFEKEFVVWEADQNLIEGKIELNKNISVHFFPEGGNLVNGISSMIAFEVLDENGNPIDVEGELLEDGIKTTLIKTLTPGYGKFSLLPLKEREYSIKLKHENTISTHSLPEPLDKGYTLRCDNRDSENLSISIESNTKHKLKDAFLIAHLRGEVQGIIEKFDRDKVSFVMDKSKMGDGIIHLTLFNNKGVPVCERLIYNDQEMNDVSMNMSIPYSNYNLRQKAKISLNLLGNQVDSVGGNYSVSITDKYRVTKYDGEHNIVNYIMFTSDLKRKVSQPWKYFSHISVKTSFARDLILMTHGWRRFNWKEIIKGKDPQLNYPPESGLTIKGQLNKKGKPISRDILVSLISEDLKIHQIQSDNNGKFILEEIAITDSTDLVFQINQKKDKKGKIKKEKDVNIKLESDIEYNINISNRLENSRSWYNNEIFQNYALSSLENRRLDSFYRTELSVDIEEISITASTRASLNKRLKEEHSFPYSDVDNRILIDSMNWIQPYYSVFDVVRLSVPGVEVVGTPNVDQQFRIRGYNSLSLSTTATVLINGSVASTGAVNALKAANIEFIDVLKGLSKTAIFGGVGRNGIVAIYTKTGGSRRRGRSTKLDGLFNTTHPGYYEARTFYSPDYGIPSSDHQKPDYRTTLYWNPNINIGEDGKALIEFFTADRTTTYDVDLQGVLDDGRVLSTQYSFDVMEKE